MYRRHTAARQHRTGVPSRIALGADNTRLFTRAETTARGRLRLGAQQNEWTGERLDFGPGPGETEMSSYPDFHRQCSSNRSTAIQQGVFVGSVGVDVTIVYGSRERKKLHGVPSSE